ncbi:uncharacterized protein lrrc41 [Menidia menidia]
MSGPEGSGMKRLRELCLRAVREHLPALRTAEVLDLPVPLIEELVPHLTVCQLEQLQPALNQRGVSTLPGWMAVLQELRGPPEAPPP